MIKHWHLITGVEPDSIAEECGVEPGDRIGSINGHEIEDFFDYQYYIEEEYLEVEVLTKDGEECTLIIEKEEEEDLGLTFESFLMDEYNSCCNKCIFCFIDQMPPGMRETLYFKDDDSRLSFLQGNYITLTNMKEKDMERVIRYHLAPINISVHTTNPELRCQMLHNRFAGDILEKIRRFYEAEIPMNSQVVLCKGINDGEELDRTIRELGEFLPFMESLSVVPVGLTKYREGLPELAAFTKEDARKILAQIQGWQAHFLEKNGTAFVHASDEWFILAEEDFPPEDYYEGFGQLENGKGKPPFIIKIAQGLVGLIFLGEHGSDHLFGAGFAHASRDANHFQIKRIPVQFGNIKKRLSGRFHQDIGEICLTQILMGNNAQSAFFDGVRDKLVGIELFSVNGNE